MRVQLLSLLLLAVLKFWTARAEVVAPVAHDQWFQLQTPSFVLFCDGRIDRVRRLAVGLEQFREGYAKLAGAKAVASLPIIVIAFPNEQAFRPFEPLYHGEPSRVGGFFRGDYDENLIALNLEAMGTGSMEVIFHEYTHLLMRHNAAIWPLWLQEGMAEVYSTFGIDNNRVCLGAQKPRHVAYLQQHPMMPLRELFSIKRDSPQYNEQEQRGIFYAESWALTHYLILGKTVRREQFSAFARRLREGVPVESAFTQSFQTDFQTMGIELKNYVTAGRFEPLCYDIATALNAQKRVTARALPEAEVLYQLGNLLLHGRRLNEAEQYFREAQKIAPQSARPYEGLGLVATRRKEFQQAISFFEQAVARNSYNFRVYFEYARAFITENDDQTTNVSPDLAKKIRSMLTRATQLMPSFAASHYLLGLFELGESSDLAQAERHLRTAMALEPENKAYMLGFAQLLVSRREYGPARQTLRSLIAANVAPEIRRQAETLLQELNEPNPRSR